MPLALPAGGECAHLYLEESLANVFARYSQYIVFHRRFIDDGFIIFSGTFEQFTALRAELTRHFGTRYTSRHFIYIAHGDGSLRS